MVEGFKHTDFGSIPNDWDDAQLGDVCEKVQDGNYGGSYPKSHEFIKIGIPFLTSKAIGKDGVLKIHLVDFISENKHEELKKAHLKLHDVLFTNRGASVGAIGFVDERIANGNIGPQLTLLRASKEKLVPHFLLQAMKSNFVQKQIIGQDAGSAMNFFGVGSTKKFKIPLPPTKAEQTAIATALNDADALIQKLEQLIAKKRNIKKGGMQELLKPKEGWQVKKLGKIADINQSNLERIPEEFIYIDLESVTQGKLVRENIIKRENSPSRAQRIVHKDDILFQTVRPYQRNNLHFQYYGNYVASTGYAIIRSRIDSGFLYAQMNTDMFVNSVLDLCTGTSYPAINPTALATILVSFPKSKSEQTRIACILSDMDNEIQELEKQLEKYKRLKQGMMQSLLTGKIRLV